MKLCKIVPILSAIAFLSGGNVGAKTQIAPSNRLNLFIDSASPFTTSDWTVATSTTIGGVKVLKSNGNTEFNLSLQIPNLGISSSGKRFLLDSVTALSASHSRISDTYNGALGQCVDFAKAMVGNTSATSMWHTGTKIGNIILSQRATQIAPGTMIAYFNGASIYPSNGTDMLLLCSV